MNDITKFGVVQGGKADQEKKLPANDYVLVDREGTEYFATGFLIFTSQHVAVMEDTGDGAVPVIVLPLDLLKVAERVEPETEQDELF